MKHTVLILLLLVVLAVNMVVYFDGFHFLLFYQYVCVCVYIVMKEERRHFCIF